MTFYHNLSIKKPKFKQYDRVTITLKGERIDTWILRRYYDIDHNKWMYRLDGSSLPKRLFREDVISPLEKKEVRNDEELTERTEGTANG